MFLINCNVSFKITLVLFDKTHNVKKRDVQIKTNFIDVIEVYVRF